MRMVVAAAVTAALCPAAAEAQQNRPLPAFAVLSSGGTRVPSGALNASARWLLVFVGDQTVAGDRLLRALNAWNVDPLRVVVVVSGDVASIDSRVRPLLGDLGASATVYADQDGSAARAMGLTSAPALIGIVDNTIDWAVQGVLNDPTMVEPVARSWLLHQ